MATKWIWLCGKLPTNFCDFT